MHLIFGGAQAGQIDPKQLADMHDRLGIDQPRVVRTWLWDVCRFDVGTSLGTGRPVIEELLVRWPRCRKLALAATAVSVIETSLTHSAPST